jgi:hypothetical protein
MKASSEKPINKVCRICKKKKLLTEFEVDESANDRHSTVCRTCDKHDYTCCQYHFEQMMIANTYNQSQLLLQMVKALQDNGAEIPRELLEKMYQIAHKGGGPGFGCVKHAPPTCYDARDR